MQSISRPVNHVSERASCSIFIIAILPVQFEEASSAALLHSGALFHAYGFYNSTF